MKPDRLSLYDVAMQSIDNDIVLLFGEFLDGFARATRDEQESLIAQEPPFSEQLDTWNYTFAATAHRLADMSQINVPSWVFDPRRIAPVVHFAFNTNKPEFQEYLAQTTPVEFTSRNLMFGNNFLARC